MILLYKITLPPWLCLLATLNRPEATGIGKIGEEVDDVVQKVEREISFANDASQRSKLTMRTKKHPEEEAIVFRLTTRPSRPGVWGRIAVRTTATIAVLAGAVHASMSWTSRDRLRHLSTEVPHVNFYRSVAKDPVGRADDNVAASVSLSALRPAWTPERRHRLYND